MVVKCEKCRTGFKVDPARIKEDGSKVRCSKCRHVFKIFKSSLEPSLGPTRSLKPATPPRKPAAVTQAPLASSFDGDLDLGDLGDDLDLGLADLDKKSKTTPGLKKTESILTDDFDLSDLGDDLNLGEPAPEKKPIQTTSKISDDFELSGLDDDLDLGVPIEEKRPVAQADELGEDFDFPDIEEDLDLGGPVEEQATAALAKTEELGEDLDFPGLEEDLDLGGPVAEKPPAALAKTEELGEDLDFPGLEEDLDLGGPVALKRSSPETGTARPGDDLSFPGIDEDLDLGEPAAEKRAADRSRDDESEFVEADSFDLGGFEDDLGFEDVAKSDTALGGMPGRASGELASPDREDDDHLGDIRLGEKPKPGRSPVVGPPDDDGIIQDYVEAGSVRPGLRAIPGGKRSAAHEDEEAFLKAAQEEVEEEGAPPAKDEKKKGRSLITLILGGILAILVVGGLGVYFFSPKSISTILAKFGGPAEKKESKDDPTGNMRISPENAKHFFRQNDTEGQLLVITGVAKNHYDGPRSFIRLKGLLHNDKGKVLAEKHIFCGNILSEEELASLPMEEINKRLNVKEGQRETNTNVTAAGSVPFMIVFEKFPNDLREYTVEVLSSEPAGQKK